jgi:hypothetical protein
MIFFGQKKDVLDHNHGNDKNHPNSQQHQNGSGPQTHHNQRNQNHNQKQQQNHVQGRPKKHPTLEKVGFAVSFFGVAFLLAGSALLVYGILQSVLWSTIAGAASLALSVFLFLLMIPICCIIRSGSRKSSPLPQQKRIQPITRRR